MKWPNNSRESPNLTFLVTKGSLQYLECVIANGVVAQRGPMGTPQATQFYALGCSPQTEGIQLYC